MVLTVLGLWESPQFLDSQVPSQRSPGHARALSIFPGSGHGLSLWPLTNSQIASSTCCKLSSKVPAIYCTIPWMEGARLVVLQVIV